MAVSVPKRGHPVVISSGPFVAQIYATRDRGYPAFTLTWRDPARGRRREKFADLGEAKKRAREVAVGFFNADSEAVEFTGKERARLGAALATLEPSGVELEVAVATFAEAHSILGGRSVIEAAREYARRHRVYVPRVTLAEAVAEFIADREKNNAAPRYLEDLRSRLTRQFEPTFAGTPLAALLPKWVADWLETRAGGARSFNNHFNVLRTFFAFCARKGWLPKDHGLLEGVERRRIHAGKIEVWTPAEMRLLLAHCPESARPAMAICAFAGLRSAEVLRLGWRSVYLSEGFIEITSEMAKTAARRLAPCPPNLVEWLAPVRKPDGRVFEGSQPWFHEAQRDAAARAGLAWRHNALRHSFISYRLAEVQDTAKVALEAGNSPAMIFRHYREVVRPTAAEEWFGIRPSPPANIAVIPALPATAGAVRGV